MPSQQGLGEERGCSQGGSRDPNRAGLPAPSSCLMTEWGEWDDCSATCGMGMKKRHRMVKMSPADGSACKAETSQAEKCMMPECREWPWGRGWGRCAGPQNPCRYHQQGQRLGACWENIRPTVLARAIKRGFP